MRTIIEIEEEKLEALTLLAKEKHMSRAALIRQAINSLLKTSLKQHQAMETDVFGILKGPLKVEGLTFQKKLRSEWHE